MSLENNDLAVSFWKQGKLCVERRNPGEAIKHFEEAVRLAPHSAHIRRSLHDARCATRTRGKVGRLENLKLIKLKAQLLVESKRENWASVFDLAHAAQAIDPWDGELCVSLADAAGHLGQEEISGLFYERAAEFNPDSRKCLEAYARLLEKTNRLPRALTIWQRLSDLCPGDEAVRRHADRLETLAYVAGKSETRSRPRKRKPSADDTVVDEGDTSHGTVPVPHHRPTVPKERQPTPQPDARQLSAESVAQVRALVKEADRLVEECRLREAGAVLKKAYHSSQSNRRIAQLLQVVQGGDAQVSARSRVESYRRLRQQK